MANPDRQFQHYDDAYDNDSYDNRHDGGYDEDQNFFIQPGSSTSLASAFGWPEQSFASPINFVEAPVEALTSYLPTRDLAPLGVPVFMNVQGSHDTSDPQGYLLPNAQSSAYPPHNSNVPQASNAPPLPENPSLTFIHHRSAPVPHIEVAENLNQKVSVCICSYSFHLPCLLGRGGIQNGANDDGCDRAR